MSNKHQEKIDNQIKEWLYINMLNYNLKTLHEILEICDHDKMMDMDSQSENTLQKGIKSNSTSNS